MRQAEIQQGGVYISKGKGIRSGRRVKVKEILAATGQHAARIVIEDLETGRTNKPLSKNFQANYEVESLPQAVTDLRAVKPPVEPVAAAPFEPPIDLVALRNTLLEAVWAIDRAVRRS